MKLELTQARPAEVAADCVVVGIFEERMLSSAAAELDERCGGRLKALVDSGDLSGRLGQVQMVFHLPELASPRVLVVGLGEQKKFDAGRFRRACVEAIRALKGSRVGTVASYLNAIDVGGRDGSWRLVTAAVASAWQAYRYTATRKPKPREDDLPERMLLPAAADQQPLLDRALAIAEGVALARELGNLPPNICNPAYLAEQARQIAEGDSRIQLEVLEREQMEALGMGALLGVARGSANPPKLIVLRYQGADESEAPYALVGKGITFDTGGISLKPGASMEEMKYDMCGAASVLGTFRAVTRAGLKLNLVTLVPAVENMPDGNAYRPGDVLTAMNGKTIEILNTDAEGRLILCDALTYVQRFKPRATVDVATLTGACVIALGKHASGLFSRDDELANALLAAGDRSMDRAWRMPLWDDYQGQIDSIFADMANVGGKSAGAITAACFLARFTEGQRWAHLDIAGSAWDEGRKGMATGRPVGLLCQWLFDAAG